MKATPSRKQVWPRKVTLGRVSVTIYKRTAPNGSPCFMVANYANGKRRFDSYADEALALEAGHKLARQMSEREVLAAAMTNEQASEYAAAVQKLAPFNVALLSAADAVAEALKTVGDLSNLHAAVKFYRQRHKTITPKPIVEVVAELLALKEARGASVRYLEDLRLRLGRFAEKFVGNIGSVTTPDVQAWLDGLKLSSQSYANFRRVVHLLFEHGVARGYCLDNPAANVERPKVRHGEVEIFTPEETRKLLAAASPEFLPCLAIGLFAGLRSAEIERLTWQDVDLKQGHIVVGADTAKTASRRIVPVAENLSAWLAPYATGKGKVWRGLHDALYDAQQDTAKAAGVKWKANACRHSFASYSFALCADAGRVAGYCGNSPSMIHKHYKQLCTAADAQKFFSIKPAAAANVLPLPAAQIANL